MNTLSVNDGMNEISEYSIFYSSHYRKSDLLAVGQVCDRLGIRFCMRRERE